ncbi:MAG: nucleotide exchange factor GrpE [Elusimicrobiota bacterium]|nr:nucleotide exchange factor GrpE [Elusimicrobiota bacterium]
MNEKINNEPKTEEICREVTEATAGSPCEGNPAGKKLSELEVLKQSVDEQKKKAQDYYEQLLRLKADFENYRKRSDSEKREHFEDGKNSLITELIDVFETVKLAKSMIEKSANGESVQQGLHLIEKKLAEILKLHEVTAIISVGEKYNPLLHEVVGVVENDEVEDDIILEEIKAGYKIDDRILKPAIVKIAKKKEIKKNSDNAEGK